MSPSTVCFSARDDNYGAFYIPTDGSIITFKLIYKYGHVNCFAPGLGLWLSRWGCNGLGRTHPMGALLTDSSRNRLLPKDRYLFGGSDCGTSQLYMLPWAGTESDELRFDNFPSPMPVSANQEYQIWFAEDLTGCNELDNGFEETCAEVHGLYVWFNRILNLYQTLLKNPGMRQFVQLLYFYFFFWLFKVNVTAQNTFCSLNIYLRPKKSVTWHRTLLGLGIEVYKKLQSLFPWIRFITMDCFRVMETGLSWVFYHQLGMTSYIGQFWNLFGSFSLGDIIFIQRDMTVNLRLSSKHY